MIFAVLDPSPLTVCINCSFLHLFMFIAVRFAYTPGTSRPQLRRRYDSYRQLRLISDSCLLTVNVDDVCAVDASGAIAHVTVVAAAVR